MSLKLKMSKMQDYIKSLINNDYNSIDLILDSLDDIIFQNILLDSANIYLNDLVFRRIFSNKKIKISEYLLLDSII